MAKRVKYKIGDVFMVPLNNRMYGAGRILKISKSTVFVELYEMPAVATPQEINESVIKNYKPLFMRWCYADIVRTGKWAIIYNCPIDKDVEMPYFWDYDIGYKKYFIQKGTDTFRCEGEMIEIQETEKDNYENSGIDYGENIEREYLKKLEIRGLLPKE